MFKKYVDVENSYQKKFLDRFLLIYPELAKTKYLITEKLHGSNVSFIYENSELKIAKRSGVIGPDEKFFGIQEFVKNSFIHQKFLSYLMTTYENFNIYGEFFGPGIQKGVKYGDQKNILFFDLMLDDVMVSPQRFLEIMTPFKELIVPIIGVVDSLEAVLNFNIDQNSTILNIEDNVWEGVVAKPFHNVFAYQHDFFYLKLKNEKFKEKANLSDKFKVLPSDAVKAHLVFLDYITDNRLQGIFSKFGPIQNINEVSKYAKLMIEDAVKDFEKDNEDLLTKILDCDKKKIFKDDGRVFKLLSSGGYI